MGVVAEERPAPVHLGKAPLPGVGLLCVDRLIAPDVDIAVESTTSGKLPLGLCWQAFASPVAAGEGVFVCEVHDGVVVLAVDGAGGAFGVALVGTGGPDYS